MGTRGDPDGVTDRANLEVAEVDFCPRAKFDTISRESVSQHDVEDGDFPRIPVSARCRGWRFPSSSMFQHGVEDGN